MKVIECKGSPSRIGQVTGESLKEEIHRHLDMVKRPDKQEWDKRLPVFLAALKKYLPDVLEEMNGIAEGAAVPPEEIYRLNIQMYPHELHVDEGCTNIVFAHGPGGPVWGKNNDGMPPGTCRPAAVRIIRPDHGIPLVNFPFCGMVATLDGMNAEGLACGHSSVGSIFQQSDYSPDIQKWGYKGLMKSRNTREFVEHMTSIPLRGKGYSIVCVDSHGTMCSLEAPCPLVQVRLPSNPEAIHCVNCYQLPALKNADRRSVEGKRYALLRWQFLDRELAKNEIYDLNRMQSLLRYHGQPSICRHGESESTHTEYSIIGLPRQDRILFLDGYPCEGVYKEIRL